MTVYGRSDIDSVTISGVGHSHARSKDERNMRVSCAECEPELTRMGWVKDPRNVELTYDEQMDAELSQVDIARFEQLKVAENAREAAASVRAAGIRTENSRANVARSKAPRRGPASA